MSKDEVECDRCHGVYHFSEYSKSQRKQEDPMCERCVAWGETQHHSVVPAPLPTGHVSIEETSGEVWRGRVFLMDEDYSKTAAPVSSREAIGLSAQGDAVTDEALRGMTVRYSGLAMSENQSVVGGSNQSVASGSAARVSSTALPPHLAKKAGASRTPSEASVGGSGMTPLPPHLRSKTTPSTSSVGRPSSSAGGPSTLPPHLARAQRKPSGSSNASVSTATTIREGKEEDKQKRATEFNAWDDQGNKMVRTRVASTVVSSATSASGSRQGSGSSSFPKAPDQGRPHRQVDVNVVPPDGVKVGKKNFPKAKPCGNDENPGLAHWPAPSW